MIPLLSKQHGTEISAFHASPTVLSISSARPPPHHIDNSLLVLITFIGFPTQQQIWYIELLRQITTVLPIALLRVRWRRLVKLVRLVIDAALYHGRQSLLLLFELRWCICSLSTVSSVQWTWGRRRNSYTLTESSVSTIRLDPPFPTDNGLHLDVRHPLAPKHAKEWRRDTNGNGGYFGHSPLFWRNPSIIQDCLRNVGNTCFVG